MANADPIETEKLQEAARQIGELTGLLAGAGIGYEGFVSLAEDASGALPERAPRVHESFRIAYLDGDILNDTPEEASRRPSLEPFLILTDEWHHQVRAVSGDAASPEARLLVASSRPATDEERQDFGLTWINTRFVNDASLARSIDDAITLVDEMENQGRIPPDALVRLLQVATHGLYAFHLSAGSWERVLIVYLPEYRRGAPHLPVGSLLTPGEFASGLLQTPGLAPIAIGDGDSTPGN